MTSRIRHGGYVQGHDETPSLRVQAANGIVIGHHARNETEFLRIRYAQATNGSLRLQPRIHSSRQIHV